MHDRRQAASRSPANPIRRLARDQQDIRIIRLPLGILLVQPQPVDYSRRTSRGGRKMTMKLPAKVQARIAQQLKKYQATITDARKRDINEADTAHLAMDILADVFGYRKIEEITSEKAIRKNWGQSRISSAIAVTWTGFRRR